MRSFHLDKCGSTLLTPVILRGLPNPVIGELVKVGRMHDAPGGVAPNVQKGARRSQTPLASYPNPGRVSGSSSWRGKGGLQPWGNRSR